MVTMREHMHGAVDWMERMHLQATEPRIGGAGTVQPLWAGSFLAMRLAVSAATERGWEVVYFSLGESGSRLTLHLLCWQAQVTLACVAQGDITNKDFVRLTHAAGKLAGLPLLISDTARTLRGICTQTSELLGKHHPKLLIVDQADQLVDTHNTGEHFEEKLALAELRTLARVARLRIVFMSRQPTFLGL